MKLAPDLSSDTEIPLDIEATKRRINRLDDSIRYRRLFIGGGAIIAASPFLTIMGGGTEDGLDLGWGSIFLIAVGVFAVVYAVIVNRKEQAEKDRLEVELEAAPTKRNPEAGDTPQGSA